MDSKGRQIQDLTIRVFFTSFIPTLLLFLFIVDVIIVEHLYLGLGLFLLIFVGIPILYKHNYAFQRNIVFLSKVNIPRFAEFKNPKKHGLNATRNFYIKTDDNCILGTWHVLPDDLIKYHLKKEEEDEYFEKTFAYNHPVVIYCHGNSSNRAASHHIELHKILRRNYHVISFDYRGFGDSTGCPHTERLVVDDAIAIVQWVRQRSSAPIFLWGHSIGTGISTYATRILEHEMGFKITGVVLENPFDNMRNEIGEHPLTMPFRLLPWFQSTFVEPMYKNGFLFKTDEHINHISCPTMILHAEDDMVVPYKLGLKLYNIAVENRSKDKGSVQFIKFEKKYGYGHKYICRSPELPLLIKNFIETCLKNNVQN